MRRAMGIAAVCGTIVLAAVLDLGFRGYDRWYCGKKCLSVSFYGERYAGMLYTIIKGRHWRSSFYLVPRG